MTDKEIKEIRRRFRPQKNNIVTVKGCIVESDKTIKSYINHSIMTSISDDCEKLLNVMKKTLSGGIGTNLINIEFTNEQVINSEEHSLLMELKNSKLKNEDALNILYSKIIEALHNDTPYAILVACDNYDVFKYNANGEKEEDSSTVFSYIIACISPIKHQKSGLYFSDMDNSFRSIEDRLILSNPELGFMFPAFDNRSSNIYNALMYTKNISNIYPDFINSVFNVTPPISAVEKKENFELCLCESLADEFNIDIIKSVHDQVSEIVTLHKEAKNEEPLLLNKNTFTEILEECSVSDEKIENFKDKFDESFGENAEIEPDALVDLKKFEINTPYVTIKIDPTRSDLISTQIIDGSRYILIRANDALEINGIQI